MLSGRHPTPFGRFAVCGISLPNVFCVSVEVPQLKSLCSALVSFYLWDLHTPRPTQCCPISFLSNFIVLRLPCFSKRKFWCFLLPLGKAALALLRKTTP